MAHPLVEQLRFTRGEWLRALDGVSKPEGATRLQPMGNLDGLAPNRAEGPA